MNKNLMIGVGVGVVIGLFVAPGGSQGANRGVLKPGTIKAVYDKGYYEGVTAEGIPLNVQQAYNQGFEDGMMYVSGYWAKEIHREYIRQGVNNE